MPAIVEVPTGQVVTNDFAQLTLDFSTEWAAHHRDGAPQLYPEDLRDEIDEGGPADLHRGQQRVYRCCGFAGSAGAYERA